MSVRFSRNELLFGQDGIRRLADARVALFGLGGVGSWTAEALARSGIGHITLVDADVVAESNINRQLPALANTLGRLKTDVVAERLRLINPEIDLELHPVRFTPLTPWDFEAYDVVIDAIDSPADKADLLLRASDAKRPKVLSSMGAALRIDPTRVDVTEFWKVDGCPLAAHLRSRFRRASTFPRRKITCVYSTEPRLKNHTGTIPAGDTAERYGKKGVNGAFCPVTATFGLTLASEAVKHLLGATQPHQ